MKLELEIYDCFCATKVFKINDIEADSSDFGSQFDDDRENAGDYACGDMIFKAKFPKREVLDKYKINADEYEEICDKLETGLSFGCCGWCV